MSDPPRFDLLDDPWVPCVHRKGGQLRELGLRDVFRRADEIREITDASPLVTISLYRLLLAILHRALDGPQTAEEWTNLWTHGWNEQRIDSYLQQWRHRFDLFDPERPFYQTSEIEYDYEISIAETIHGFTLGNYSTLFDHHVANNPPALSPAQAARYLVAFQNFAPGGLISFRSKHGEPANPYKYAKAGLLTKAAVSLVKGNTLRETMILNLNRYSRSDGEPFSFGEEDDRPAWERDKPALAVDRRPTGYVDLLTWQGRRMRLRPEAGPDNAIVVRHVVRMKGDQLPDGAHLADFETMVPFRKNPRAKPHEPAWSEIALYPDRALWRDSAALFQAIEDERRQPRIARWLAELAWTGDLDSAARFNVDLYGMSVDRANIYLWRHETLPMPLEYVRSRELFDQLQQALNLAEGVGRLFTSGYIEVKTDTGETYRAPSPMRVFASTLLSPANEQAADPDQVRAVVDSLAPGRVYWSRLETPFKEFMLRLDEAWSAADQETSVDEQMARWAEQVRASARAAFNETVLTLDLSDRELKALARGERAMNQRLAHLVEPFVSPTEEVQR
jgi:CRISPR system Cascade subunit CasA